jgi:hypothetical protein
MIQQAAALFIVGAGSSGRLIQLKPTTMKKSCFKFFLHPSPTFVGFAGAAFWVFLLAANRLLKLLSETRHWLPITTPVLEPTHTLVH